MSITFKPLTKSNFPLLLKWLETPHVKAWWDEDIKWDIALIHKKYDSYVYGYKFENSIRKKIQAYIIEYDNRPIGYIQIYNAYDFPRSKPLINLPENLAAFDIFIGEKDVLGRGVGAKALVSIEDYYDSNFTHIFADPDKENLAAIRTYEKAGFRKIQDQEDTKEIWMVKKLNKKCNNRY
jgi:RimJ/RimL family protein N-acetyltransferase